MARREEFMTLHRSDSEASSSQWPHILIGDGRHSVGKFAWTIGFIQPLNGTINQSDLHELGWMNGVASSVREGWLPVSVVHGVWHASRERFPLHFY